jgi:YhcH/YjgK/YiaL family protein
MKKISFMIFLLSSVVLISSAQSSNSKWTEKKADKWFKKKEYLNGLAATPHEAIDKIQFAEQYQVNKTIWDKAFAYLKEIDLQTLTNGKQVIDGDNIYAFVTEAPSKDYDKTAFESHKNYIDLQFVIRGEENMGRTTLKKVKLDKEYNERNDIMFYTGDGEIYTIPENTFILFFPSDAHRPNITPGGNKVVKKIVVKIRFAKS